MEFDIKYFNSFIKNSNLYYAHLPNNAKCPKNPELLTEHLALTYSYSLSIIEIQSLKNIIDNLIISSIPFDMNIDYLKLVIEELFFKSIAYHDLGKVNKLFQIKRMSNNADILVVKHRFDSNHSIIGVYIYLFDFFKKLLSLKLSEKEQIFLSNVALYFSYSILQHHNTCLINCQNDTIWDNDDLLALEPYISLFDIGYDTETIQLFHRCLLKNANFNFLFDSFNDLKNNRKTFPLYVLCRLNFSLLTASDYLATAHFMNDWPEMYTDYGLIDSVLKNKIINSIKNSKSYNKNVYEAIEKNDITNFDKLSNPSNANLNELRKSIAMDVVRNTDNNANNRLFYIEAPTGGGKTNVSMLALAELLKNDNDYSINKVFYVFPYTTLITQTYVTLCDTLELKNDEIAEIHSKAIFRTGRYEDDYLNYLDNLLVSYPITLLSHIRFFDILKTNDKETNYLLHRIANSIVIIDEIQSYPPIMWDRIVYFINHFSHYFNMRFIVMSATLPKIGEILNNNSYNTTFTYLIDNKERYFQNINFCNRVKFDYSLLDNNLLDKGNKSEYLLNLMRIVFEKSEEYAKLNTIIRDSVYTIIEFIFKNTASEFYSMVLDNNSFFDEIFLLSGTILEPRRKEIISLLKSLELRKKKVLLISTQVVEAGVDIDMDLGFKDKSIIDSEEQLAGRINRNVNKPECTLYIFNCDTEKSLYGKDYRYQFAEDMGIEEYKEILSSKDFDKLYKKIITKIQTDNKSVYNYKENINELETAIAELNYKKVDKQLELIKSLNDTVFVPIDIPIKYFKNQLNILNELNVVYGSSLSGANVWAAFENTIISDETQDFISMKIRIKKLQSVMANFTFSIFKGGKDYELLKTYGVNKYGFLYLESYNEIYSFNDGVLTSKFENSQFI